MKIITLEEHFQLPAIKEALTKLLPGAQNTPPQGFPRDQLEDLGMGRLKALLLTSGAPSHSRCGGGFVDKGD